VPLTGAQGSNTPEPFALEPDGVTFGMNAEGVAKLYDAWWDKRFVSKYKKANPGPKTRELDFELAEHKKVLRRVVNFEGRSSVDSADFREEFEHGNGESMTSAELLRRGSGVEGAKAEGYVRRFFFFQNRLWKVYDEYKLDPKGLLGADFKEAAARIETSLGKGAKRTRGTESKFENVAFDAGGVRIRLVKLPDNRVAVVRADAALAREVLDRRAQHSKGPERTLDAETQAAIR